MEGTNYTGVTDNTDALRACLRMSESHSLEVRLDRRRPISIWKGEESEEDAVFLTGPFNLTSGTTLRVGAGVVLKASDDRDLFPDIAPLATYGQGVECAKPGQLRKAPFIGAYNASGVVVTGSGAIDRKKNSMSMSYLSYC